jgi:hypothetical protein
MVGRAHGTGTPRGRGLWCMLHRPCQGGSGGFPPAFKRWTISVILVRVCLTTAAKQRESGKHRQTGEPGKRGTAEKKGNPVSTLHPIAWCRPLEDRRGTVGGPSETPRKTHQLRTFAFHSCALWRTSTKNRIGLIDR